MYSFEQRKAMFPEIDLIENDNVRKFAEYCLWNLPEYFFHIPASSSGKYHPAYALGEGGLVRHTKAAMNIFRMMTENDASLWYQSDSVSGLTGTDFNDACYLALLVHDGFKSGVPANNSSETPPNNNTVHEHPLLAESFLQTVLTLYASKCPQKYDPVFLQIVNAAAIAVQAHMGKWAYSKYSNVVLPTPDCGDWMAKMVHLCDYIASRKELDFNFSAVPPITK